MIGSSNGRSMTCPLATTPAPIPRSAIITGVGVEQPRHHVGQRQWQQHRCGRPRAGRSWTRTPVDPFDQ